MHAQRKLWTKEEDQILKLLRQERSYKKWSVIARKMQQQFDIKGKTGKKCRERYINYLNPQVESFHWSSQQDDLLIKYHQQYGNKWSIIAQNLNRKSQNCVKNRFYSKFRKMVRKLNHFIAKNKNLQLSQISLGVVYKIISTSESRFKIQSKMCEYWIQLCTKIVSQIYSLQANNSKDQIREQDYPVYCETIKKIKEFQLNFKKRKVRKNQQNQEDYKGRFSCNEQTKNRQVKVRIRSKLGSKNMNLDQQDLIDNEKQEQIPLQLISQAEKNSNQINFSYSWLKIDSNVFGINESFQIQKNSSYFQMFSISQEYPGIYSNL